jgi:hypothetical protein
MTWSIRFTRSYRGRARWRPVPHPHGRCGVPTTRVFVAGVVVGNMVVAGANESDMSKTTWSVRVATRVRHGPRVGQKGERLRPGPGRCPTRFIASRGTGTLGDCEQRSQPPTSSSSAQSRVPTGRRPEEFPRRGSDVPGRTATAAPAAVHSKDKFMNF